jgi:hypothetical protein
VPDELHDPASDVLEAVVKWTEAVDGWEPKTLEAFQFATRSGGNAVAGASMKINEGVR